MLGIIVPTLEHRNATIVTCRWSRLAEFPRWSVGTIIIYPYLCKIQVRGALNTKMAKNAPAAIAHNTPCFNAREPMRYAANNTMAVTTGLMS